MSKIRTAVVGAGKMGAIHAKVYRQLAQSELVAVVDVDDKKAQKLAKKYKCSAFTDSKVLIGKVDAVTIAAPTEHHLQLAKMFIDNNVAVMIEKPLAANTEDARKIVELAKKKNIVVLYLFNCIPLPLLCIFSCRWFY